MDSTVCSSTDNPSGPVVVCGEICAGRYQAAAGPVRTTSVGGQCIPCAECGLVLVAAACPSCGGVGCGVHDWYATRQADEFTDAFLARTGRAPGPTDLEAGRLYASVYPDAPGAMVADALVDSAADADALIAGLEGL